MSKTVLLIDKNPIFSNGVTKILEEAGIKVLATVSNSDAGIELSTQLTPRIILLDTSLIQLNSLVILGQLRAHNPNAKIALLTWQANSNQLKRALQEGINGYLSKDIEPDILITAIRDIAAGKTVVPPEFNSVLTRFERTQTNRSDPPDLSDLFASLTPREYETLVLLTRGLNNKIIARQMGLTEGTVKNHVKAILNKLNVDSRINAAVLALEQGIGAEFE